MTALLSTLEALAGALLAAALVMFWRGLFPSRVALRRNWVWDLAQAELAIKRQHEQLRAAVELALGAWNNVKMRDALRAALDSTPAEPECLRL